MRKNNKKRCVKNIFFVLIILMNSLFLSGCWDSVDIDLLSFPLATGYDLHVSLEEDQKDEKAEGDVKEPKVDVTSLVPTLIPNIEPKEQIETISASNVAYTRALREYRDDSIYFPGTLQVLVIGRDLALQGIRSQTDSLSRLSVMPSSLFICLSEGRAEEILRTPVDSNRNVAFYLQEMFNGLNDRIYLKSTTLHDFITNQGSGKNPIVPVVGVRGDGKIEITGCGVFEKDKLLRILDINDARKLTLLRGDQCIGYIPYEIKHDGKHFDEGALRLRNSRSVKVSKEDGKWHFTIQVFLTGSIMERERTFRIRDYTPESIEELESVVAEQVQQELETFVQWMQQDLGVDCIDICRFALAKERKELEGVIDTPYFICNAQIDVETQVTIQNWGEKE